jgi:hypothetical protein
MGSEWIRWIVLYKEVMFAFTLALPGKTILQSAQDNILPINTTVVARKIWETMVGIPIGCSDPNFNDRAYTASWAETLLQDFVSRNYKKVKCEWERVETDPIHESPINIGDNGGSIVLYMCIKFDY